VLALDKEIMVNGTPQAKGDHLLAVMTAFLKEHVDQMVLQATPAEASSEEAKPSAPTPSDRKGPITQSKILK